MIWQGTSDKRSWQGASWWGNEYLNAEFKHIVVLKQNDGHQRVHQPLISDNKTNILTWDKRSLWTLIKSTKHTIVLIFVLEWKLVSLIIIGRPCVPGLVFGGITENYGLDHLISWQCVLEVSWPSWPSALSSGPGPVKSLEARFDHRGLLKKIALHRYAA